MFSSTGDGRAFMRYDTCCVALFKPEGAGQWQLTVDRLTAGKNAGTFPLSLILPFFMLAPSLAVLNPIVHHDGLF